MMIPVICGSSILETSRKDMYMVKIKLQKISRGVQATETRGVPSPRQETETTPVPDP